jgi:hypothetical protein
MVLMVPIGTLLAAPRETPIPASKLFGKPTIELDAGVFLYIWIDGDGLHVRWTTAGKPVLFSGRLSCDRPLEDLKRVLDVGSGWVTNHGDRTLMFSATSRNGLDGFDLSVPHGQRANLDLRIDGNTPSIDQIRIGSAKTMPAGIPTVFLLR